MKLSVIIPHYKESLLDWTIENIKRVEPKAEIIPMEDAKQEGVGLMRHRGIKQAKHDNIIIVDAHMDFSEDCFQEMAKRIDSNPTDIVCCDCRGLTEEKVTNDSHRYGANFYEVRPGKEPGNTDVFVSKWRRVHEGHGAHAVPIILGGCYAISRDWYFNGLGAVWQYHRGWGKSEQLLALMNYYMGGECICVPDVWASHLFRKSMMNNFGNLVRNTFLVLHGFVPEERREQLLNCIAPAGRTPDYCIKGMNKDGSIKGIRNYIEAHAVRNYSDIKEVFTRAKPKANYTATEKPRNCPKCKSLASTVTKTYDIHRRNRLCSDCGYAYLTFSAML